MTSRRVAMASLALLACGSDGADTAGEPSIPDRPAYGEWLEVRPDGAVCGNGSQYKFFVNYSETSNDLVVAFEPGGACWDYDSCTGKAGVLGAANIGGIPSDHMDVGGRIVPFFRREYADNPTREWNLVYVPYCTGDVHTGNNVVTYEDPTGAEPPIEFHHAGHENTQLVLAWLAEQFPAVPRLFATGCSAGGVGVTLNYHYLRQALPWVERAYLLADSGPIFPSDGFSRPLHDEVYRAWDVESLLDDLPAGFAREDFGSLNAALSRAYPGDRLAMSVFRRDFGFSRYSYERFHDLPAHGDPGFKAAILEMWSADIDAWTASLDGLANVATYVPYWRQLNDSHCTTLLTYDGADIAEADMTMGQFIDDLLDDSSPLASYVETPQPGEDE